MQTLNSLPLWAQDPADLARIGIANIVKGLHIAMAVNNITIEMAARNAGVPPEEFIEFLSLAREPVTFEDIVRFSQAVGLVPVLGLIDDPDLYGDDESAS